MAKWLGSIRGHRFITSFHLAALIHHMFVTYYLTFKIDLENHIHKSKHIRVMFEFTYGYVTSWNFTVQCVYFALCLAHDLLQMTDSAVLQETKENVVRLRNFTFRVFTFPLALTVSIMFWVLFHFDRSFVFPAEAEALVPSWCNHAVHTNIAILVLVEIATTCHSYSPPESRRTAILSVIVYTTVYFLCYLGTYVHYGVWLYPMYDIINWSQRFLHIFCSYILAVGSYLCGESLSLKIWENTMPDIHFARRKIQ